MHGRQKCSKDLLRAHRLKKKLLRDLQQAKLHGHSDIKSLQIEYRKTVLLVKQLLRRDRSIQNQDTQNREADVSTSAYEILESQGASEDVFILSSSEQPLHEWHRCPFTIDNVTYQTVGQYVLYHLVMKLGWQFSWFTDAPLDVLKSILSYPSVQKCAMATSQLIESFCQQCDSHVLMSDYATHIEPLLHKAYRVKMAAWPDIAAALIQTKNALIVRSAVLEDGYAQFEPTFTSGCSESAVRHEVARNGISNLLHHLVASQNAVQDDQTFLARNLVGMVLMELRLYFGGQSLPEMLKSVGIDSDKNGYNNSFCCSQPFMTTDSRPIQSVYVPNEPVSGYEFVTCGHSLSAFDMKLFHVNWHRYFSVIEYCLADLLHRLGLYDGPLEVNSILFKSCQGDSEELASLLTVILSRRLNDSSDCSKVIENWKTQCLYTLLLEGLRAKLKSSHQDQDLLLNTYPRLLLNCQDFHGFGLSIELSAEQYEEVTSTENHSEPILLKSMLDELKPCSPSDTEECRHKVCKNLYGLALMHIRHELWEEREAMRIAQEQMIMDEAKEAMRLELERLSQPSKIVIAEDGRSSEYCGDSESTSTTKPSDVVVDKGTKKIVIKKKVVETPAEQPSVSAPLIAAVDKSQRKIVIKKKQQPTEVLPPQEMNSVVPKQVVFEAFDAAQASPSGFSENDEHAQVPVDLPTPSSADKSATIKRKINALERLKSLNFGSKRSTGDASALQVLIQMEKKISSKLIDHSKNAEVSESSTNTLSVQRPKPSNQPPLPIVREKLVALDVSRGDLSKLDEPELRILVEHFRLEKRDLSEHTALQRQQIRTLKQKIEQEQRKQLMQRYIVPQQLPWASNVQMDPSFAHGQRSTRVRQPFELSAGSGSSPVPAEMDARYFEEFQMLNYNFVP